MLSQAHPDVTGDAHRGIAACQHAHKQWPAEIPNGGHAHNDHHGDGQKRGNGGVDRPAHGLPDGLIHNICKIRFGIGLGILSGPVKHHDGGVDGVTQNGQRRRNKVGVEGNAEDDIGRQHYKQVMAQRADRSKAGAEVKPNADIHQHAQHCNQCSDHGGVPQIGADRSGNRGAGHHSSIRILRRNGIIEGVTGLIGHIQCLDHHLCSGAAGGGHRRELSFQNALGNVLHLGGICLLPQIIGHGHAAQKINIHIKEVHAEGQGHKASHAGHHKDCRDNEEKLKVLYKAECLILKHLTSPPSAFSRHTGRGSQPLRPPAPSS